MAKEIGAKSQTERSKRNADLHAAHTQRKDEFYTQIQDIEKETRYYKKHFAGKAILCNCDDPYASHFFLHFFRKFSAYGLKKLVSVCYKNCQPDLFSQNADEHSISLEYTGGADESRDPTKDEISQWVRPLKGDGDFRSAECIEILKQADIVVTNPPFSLPCAIDPAWQEVSDHRQRERNHVQGDVSAHHGEQDVDGREHPQRRQGVRRAERLSALRRRMQGGCRRQQVLDYKERHEDITLYKNYSPEAYPKYDNYDAINVNATADIPCDYDGVMGVPITFLDRYNPDQFAILGNEYTLNIERGRGYVNGKRKFGRIFIRKIKKEAK